MNELWMNNDYNEWIKNMNNEWIMIIMNEWSLMWAHRELGYIVKANGYNEIHSGNSLNILILKHSELLLYNLGVMFPR